jgi:hypothetical protein
MELFVSDNEVNAGPVRRRNKARSPGARVWLWWVVGGGGALLVGGLVLTILFVASGPQPTPIASRYGYESCAMGQRVAVEGELSLSTGDVTVISENLVNMRALATICEGMKASDVSYSNGTRVQVVGTVADKGTMAGGIPVLFLRNCSLRSASR